MAIGLKCILMLGLCALFGCVTEQPLTRVPPWHDGCIEDSRERIEHALDGAQLSSDIGQLLPQLLYRLPPEERRAIARAAASATTQLGHSPRSSDLRDLRALSRRAFSAGFSDSTVCRMPRESSFLTAEYFIDALNVYLFNRGVISSQTFAIDGVPSVGRDSQTELMSWLIITASQPPPNNSFKPKPLRGSA